MARCGLIWVFLSIIFIVLLVNFLLPGPPVYKFNCFTSKQKNKIDKLLYEEDVNKNLVSENETELYQSLDKCETIHIGVVCSGYKSILQFFTMVKSLYFYRSNPIHFHIMVNKFSEKILKTLFETWAVPQVSVTFYNLSDFITDVRWIPNSHYSGIHGLLKLVFPKVIPIEVTNKLILIDTDLTFTSDIYELWQLFSKFRQTQAIGLVDNQSDYYIRKRYSLWPAIGRGYNTGIILYDLQALKDLGWPHFWERIAKKAASVYGATKLADQDIMNTIIKQNPDIVYQVPCSWNTQLSDQSLSYNCYKDNPVKVIHWNSPRKINVVNRDGDYFRSIYTTFLEMNGNLLKKQLHDCSTNTSKSNTTKEFNICSPFYKAKNETFRTLLFFRKFEYTPTRNDVTYSTHLSFDRLQMVEELSRHWTGPISITLYLTDPQLQEAIDYIDQSEILQSRSNIAFHAVFKDGPHYPINLLRNVGLRNVNTPYVFLSDIDFLPMRNLYGNLKTSINSVRDMKKVALIVPAFESQAYRSKIPKSKMELLQMMENKMIFTFRHDVWPAGHAATNYDKWKTTRLPYEVKWERDYEPYIVVRSDVTEYDNRFMGFGWNKVSHIMELHAQGYSFQVLPMAFIIHKPHGPSSDIAKFRESPIYRMCIQNIKEEFVAMLKSKYGFEFDATKNIPFIPPVSK